MLIFESAGCQIMFVNLKEKHIIQALVTLTSASSSGARFASRLLGEGNENGVNMIVSWYGKFNCIGSWW